MRELPEAILKKNDKRARILIGIASALVFFAVLMLGRYSIDVKLPFDEHLFAFINATINSCVALLLVFALIAIKQRRFILHRNLMLGAMILSMLFLLSYIAHHLFTDPTSYPPGNKAARTIYYILLATHIPLAGLILPMILFTAYRALTADYTRHKKLARITWPVWFYVAISGVAVYWMIKPYY